MEECKVKTRSPSCEEKRGNTSLVRETCLLLHSIQRNTHETTVHVSTVSIIASSERSGALDSARHFPPPLMDTLNTVRGTPLQWTVLRSWPERQLGAVETMRNDEKRDGVTS